MLTFQTFCDVSEDVFWLLKPRRRAFFSHGPVALRQPSYWIGLHNGRDKLWTDYCVPGPKIKQGSEDCCCWMGPFVFMRKHTLDWAKQGLGQALDAGFFSLDEAF